MSKEANKENSDDLRRYLVARKRIEKSMELHLKVSDEFSKGYTEGCRFALNELEAAEPHSERSSHVNWILDRIAKMEQDLEVLRCLVDVRLDSKFDKWGQTLSEAWEMINEDAR